MHPAVTDTLPQNSNITSHQIYALSEMRQDRITSPGHNSLTPAVKFFKQNMF